MYPARTTALLVAALMLNAPLSAVADERVPPTPLPDYFSIAGIRTGQTLTEVDREISAMQDDILKERSRSGTISVNKSVIFQGGSAFGSKIEVNISDNANINGQAMPKNSDVLTVLFSDPASDSRVVGIKRVLQWKPGYGPSLPEFVKSITAKYREPTLFQEDGRSILFIMDKNGQVVKNPQNGRIVNPLSAPLNFVYCRSQMIEQFENNFGAASMFIATFWDGRTVSEAQIYLRDSAYEIGAMQAKAATEQAARQSATGASPRP